MMDPKHELSVTRQAELMGISRAAVYYVPRSLPQADLALMRRLDQLHLEYPFAGARMLRDMLNAEGSHVGRKHMGTLMARMGIEALVRRQSETQRRLYELSWGKRLSSLCSVLA
jgi:putative transposase